MSYGYTDSSEVGPGKSGGKFGLNSGVILTKFEYNAQAGKEGAAQDAIDVDIQIGEKEFKNRYFPISKVYAKEGGEITDTTSEAYKAGLEKETTLLNALLCDIVKCFVPEEDIKLALSTPISSFADYAKILERLVKSNTHWNKTPLDVFLQYQFKPSGTNTRTFLEIPKNVKQGPFICKSLGNYKEERTSSHLRYVNEAGEVHPFKRGQWFVDSDFAKVTGVLENAAPQGGGASTGTAVGW